MRNGLGSNWTLRFPRTAREIYGQDIRFDTGHGHRRGDFYVLLFIVFVLGFILGLIVTGG